MTALNLVSAFRFSFSALQDRGLRHFIIQSALGALLVTLGIAGAFIVTAHLLPPLKPIWLDALLRLVIGGSGFFAALWFFPAAVLVVASIMGDALAEALEKRFLPGQTLGRALPFFKGLWFSARLVLAAFLFLLVLAPFLLFPLTAPIAALIFWLAGAWLVAREFFMTIARRYQTSKNCEYLWRRHRLQLWLAAFPLAALSPIPFFNLLMPFIAATLFFSLYKQAAEIEHRLL